MGNEPNKGNESNKQQGQQGQQGGQSQSHQQGQSQHSGQNPTGSVDTSDKWKTGQGQSGEQQGSQDS